MVKAPVYLQESVAQEAECFSVKKAKVNPTGVLEALKISRVRYP